MALRIFRLVAILCFPILLAACGQQSPPAGPSKKVVVASEASFPPMEFVEDSGAIVGFDIDLIKVVAAAADVELEIKNVAWDGIFGALKSGTADVIASSVTITDERKGQFDFSTPYLRAGQVILVRTADKGAFPDLASLKGKRVGVQISTTGAERMQKEPVELKQYNTAGLAVIDLINGNVDAVMIDRPVADYYAARKAEFAKKVVVAGEPYTTEQFGFVVRKGDAELLAKLNRGLEKVKDDGTLAKLEEKWFR
ncbi:MAG: basic amino acid ABC transporter substrate-binding protein [Candidatus Sumerlaeaceae bacterium]|nr:basic amino acid ABC transporter substrate-binding protein [Candidatus Sumerlaeaceae bacterium]